MIVLFVSLLALNAASGRFADNIESITISKTNFDFPSPKLPPPPPVDDAARMARYVVHYSEWTSLSHISHQAKQNISGLALGRVYSVTDGPIGKSTGIPYIYVSLFDGTPRDLQDDPKCAMTMSMAQGDFCSSKGLDAEDPRCPQVMLFGDFEYLKNDTEEWDFASKAMFTRHPSMKNWPASHGFRFGKLNINKIILVDNIGGSKYPSVKDYFASPPPQYAQLMKTELDVKYVKN